MNLELRLEEISKEFNEKTRKLKEETKSDIKDIEFTIKNLRYEISQKNNRESDIQYLRENLRTFMAIYKDYMYCEGMGSFYNARSNALWAEAKSIKTIITAFNDKYAKEV